MSKYPRIAVTHLRDELAEHLNAIRYGRGRVVVQKNGKDHVAIVSLEDLAVVRWLESHKADLLNEVRRSLALDAAQRREMRGMASSYQLSD